MRLMGTLLCSNWLNLCGMWFHSADLDCAAEARHTLAWQESRIPFSAKDAWANINQTGNQGADGLSLSKLLRPLIPMHPFSTHCFTCLIEAQVIEIQSAKGGECPGTEIRTPVPVTHAVTWIETSQEPHEMMNWGKSEGTRPARKHREKLTVQTDKRRKKRREIG